MDLLMQIIVCIALPTMFFLAVFYIFLDLKTMENRWKEIEYANLKKIIDSDIDSIDINNANTNEL